MSRRRKKIRTFYNLEVILPKGYWRHKKKCMIDPPVPFQDGLFLRNKKQVDKYLRKAFFAGVQEILVERITSYFDHYNQYRNSSISSITYIRRK